MNKANSYCMSGFILDGLGKLKPAFGKDGTITAGNAPGLNRGEAVA
tara:strand:- start:2405 stop:2542 length:138 start_codon:yes stop_codon:yes gene_type:complete